MKKIVKQTVLAALFAGLGMGATLASAQTAGLDTKGTVGYVIDSRGYVAKSGTGLCWRTGFWTPAQAIAECDADLAAKPVPPKDSQPVKQPQPAGPGVHDIKVKIPADALFDFDKATLRAEGKSALDGLVSQAKSIKLEVIIVVGHTDRIGKDAYNQKLSERRAAAVKEYLVSKGIEANRVYTEGKGEKQPVTGDKCKKMGPESGKNKKLVACLQPDRRVEVEVIGTK